MYTKKRILIITGLIVGFGLITALIYYILGNQQATTATTNTVDISGEPLQKLVVLISMDGLGSNLINIEDTPYLVLLLSDSDTSSIMTMQALQQSETMPNHISMITGLNQEHHGFYANSVDAGTQILAAKSLFDYAIEKDYQYYAFVTKEKLLYMAGDKSGPNIVYRDELSDLAVNDINNLVTSQSDKIFLFIHLRDIDTVGHAYGWGSPEQKSALKQLDTNIELLLTDLSWKYAAYQRFYILTADHGGEGLQHSNGCNACRAIPLMINNNNTNNPFTIKRYTYNIFDVACVTMNIMGVSDNLELDCRY